MQLVRHPAGAAGHNLFDLAAATPAVKALLSRLGKGGAFPVAGVSRGGQSFLASLLSRLLPGSTLVLVTEGVKNQELFHLDVETWVDLETSPRPKGHSAPARAFYYPAWEILPHEARLPHADVISERLETLVALTADSREKPRIIVASVAALLQRTFHRDDLRSRTRTVKKGEQIDPLDLVEWLEDQGYEPEAQVDSKGQIALRGGILDVFPLISPWPVRVEFFGNDVESLRYFDPITQISNEEIPAIVIPPAGELGVLKKWLADAKEDDSPRLATLLDHLPAGAIFLIAEPDLVADQAAVYAATLPANDPFFIHWDELQEKLRIHSFTCLNLTEQELSALEATPPEQPELDDLEIIGRKTLPLPKGRGEGEQHVRGSTDTENGRSHRSSNSQSAIRNPQSLDFASLDAYRPIIERAPDPQVAEAQRREFFAQLHRWARQDYAVHVFCNNDGERQRFEEIYREYGLDEEPLSKRIFTTIGTLSRGFISDSARLVIVTDAEIFGRYKVQRPRRLKSRHAQTSRSLLDIDFTDLQEGDYVVHLQHGIGRYIGLQSLPGGGGDKPLDKKVARIEAGEECLVIEYASGDPNQPAPRLYVPVTEAHLVSKYVGAGKARPPLNTLGGGRWAKTKEQAERAVRDLAGELLAVQAARASQPGHPFPGDTPGQLEFESSFIFEETPDQARAITQTKKDMETARPMDRLICGDVGFGKTEVAIRAAFKAVMGGKQVAVLVPTTVLAQQHFNTFRERMADYPVRIELLSRYRTTREQKKIVQGLAAGNVDIVIGTHRLVQSDIAFKDLGLVVIDEEQRFGVLHKERFKLLRQLVDVLTLSATPIPRTLHLALTGARDMSTIETPPQDRLPVETIVTQYDERVIRDAIQRELNREGQVFYLHNRVFDIDAVAHKLRALLPRARIVVGHGQMDTDELEDVMTKFVNGEADVLLSTTIIESGLDIPNANTIIIDRADRFGLSDLYQLRGRVGRYKHQAYAYLLIPRHAGLLSDARKRISAIKQYSTLGSGFKIAMRDLEIRGAGNILGAQQSGHITAVGFELYCQLLKQSVSSLRGEKVKPRLEVHVRLDFLPQNAVQEAAEAPERKSSRKKSDDIEISVPRETATYVRREPPEDEDAVPVKRSAAYIPLKYISDARQRIEIYRKFAELNDQKSINTLRRELRDRFGVLPEAVELLLEIAALKLLAAERGITSIESAAEKLMLTRNNDYLMVAGKFPRLTKPDSKSRLKEIKRLIQALQERIS